MVTHPVAGGGTVTHPTRGNELKSAEALKEDIETLAKVSTHPYTFSPAQHEAVRKERAASYTEQKASPIILTEAEIKARRLSLAILCIGECLTDLANRILEAQLDESKLGSIACGLERAACYVRGVPYKPNLPSKEE